MVIEISTCSLDVMCKFSLFFCMVYTLCKKNHQCWCLTLRTQGLTGVLYYYSFTFFEVMVD